MDRRAFVAGSLGLLAAPLAAEAQLVAKVYRIGFLGAISASAYAPFVEALRQGLREQGYVEGTNIVIEYRWAEGRLDRLPDLAAELVHLKVDLIVAHGTQAPVAAKQATRTIPIVMTSAGDPVASGLVASLARPGGNVTGFGLLIPELGAKRLQLFKEIIPGLSRVALLWNPANPYATQLWKETAAGASTLGMRLQSLKVRDASELEGAFREASGGRADILVIAEDPLTVGYRTQIAAPAAKNRLPAMAGFREFVDAGGLLSYGASLTDLYRRAAIYVDKILKGATPADLPIEQPTKFELVINLKTAKALGLTIPPAGLARADEVINP